MPKNVNTRVFLATTHACGHQDEVAQQEEERGWLNHARCH